MFSRRATKASQFAVREATLGQLLAQGLKPKPAITAISAAGSQYPTYLSAANANAYSRFAECGDKPLILRKITERKTPLGLVGIDQVLLAGCASAVNRKVGELERLLQ